MTRRGRLTSAPRTAVDLTIGSWLRTAIAAVVVGVIFVAAVAVALHVGDLRHTSFPGHPPAGYYHNPFSDDPGDLINAADAARVRADFQRDGQLEVDALARGDASLLDQADAGGRQATLRQLIAQDNAAGTLRRYDNHVTSLVVGRRAAPAGSSSSWFVEEAGTATQTDVARSGGKVLRTQRYRFDGRFWLARSGDRYVITDAAISNEPLTGS